MVPLALQNAVRTYLFNKELPEDEERRQDVDFQAASGWFLSCEGSLLTYRNLVDHLVKTAPTDLTSTERRKWARQAARSVLPGACETKLFVTGNARAFRNAIELRVSRHADPEIRMVFSRVWEILNQEAPNLFSDYEKTMLPDGTFELITKNRKV